MRPFWSIPANVTLLETGHQAGLGLLVRFSAELVLLSDE
jgi:hypothetical protein